MMMKKEYKKPCAHIYNLVLDSYMNNGSTKPGNGYGDNNHHHEGHGGGHPVKDRYDWGNDLSGLW